MGSGGLAAGGLLRLAWEELGTKTWKKELPWAGPTEAHLAIMGQL